MSSFHCGNCMFCFCNKHVRCLLPCWLANLPEMQEPWFEPWVRKLTWRRKWQPTPVFLHREFHGERILVDYTSWGHKELDMTEKLTISLLKRYFLINCKKDSDHPFHKSCKVFVQSSREPANFCKVQFCEVFGWMGSSRVQVCAVLLMWLGWWKDLGRQKRNDKLHPVFCENKASDILWFEVAHEMGSFESLAEKQLSGTFNEELFQKEHLTEIFTWGRAISHPYGSGEKGYLLRLFSRSSTGFSQFWAGESENLCIVSVEYVDFPAS